MKKTSGTAFFVLLIITAITIFMEFRALNSRITPQIIASGLLLFASLCLFCLRMGKTGQRQSSVWSGGLKLVPIALGVIAGILVWWWLWRHFHANQ